MAESDPGIQGLLKLKQQHKTILDGLETKISQLERYLSDYETVDSLLEDLPKRLSHSGTLIPFSGKKALVFGALENTNEVMVYLGSDHFASVSAHHGRGIVHRRMETLKTQITASKEERDLLTDRLNFTDDFVRERCSDTEGGGIIDIREELDEEEELRWSERHRALVAQERKKKNQIPVEKEQSDNDLFRRLEELERLEEEEEMTEQANKDHELVPIINTSRKATAFVGNCKGASAKKKLHVHFDDEPSARIEEEVEEEEEEEERRSPFISFRHTPNLPAPPTDAITPASLNALCSHRILSTTEAGAVGDLVVERIPSIETNSAPPPAETVSRPKSRFRARRTNPE